MELKELIQKFGEFLTEFYYQELLKAEQEGKPSIEIDFSSLEKFDTELADHLLENPEEILEQASEILRNAGIEMRLNLRFFNLPEEKCIRIRNLRAEHSNKFLVIDGIVKRASEVRPEVEEAVYSCPQCGNKICVSQAERTLTRPTECDCGNRKNFKLMDQKLFDARWITVEEPYEIVSGERPSELMVYLKEDLTTPQLQTRTDPGNRIKITGILKQLPRRIKGTRSRQLEIYLEANYVEPVEIGWEEIEITPEDEKKILELASDPMIYDMLVASIAPSLYGLENIKLAIALQLFGGVPHAQKDKSRVRGDLHLLLVGDPSCLVGDERIVLANGAIVKISSLGSEHLEKIEVPLYLGKQYEYGIAKVFHKYEFQPIIEIITESGKSIKGTFNQPLLVKENVKGTFGKPLPTFWKRLDEIKIGDGVRTIVWIPCRIYSYVKTHWQSLTCAEQSKKIRIPEVVDEKLASILGYLIVDGYVQKYGVGCVFNPEELDLIPLLKAMFQEVFRIKPRFDHHKTNQGKKVEMVFNSIELAKILHFVRNRRVPDLILQSKNSVVAAFLSWLYDGDGTASAKGRGKNAILFKAKDMELLRDIQILLLRFGIHSSIYGKNLIIRQKNSIISFAKFIGFNSKKKQQKLQELVEKVSKLKRDRHKKLWEKVVKIIYHPPETVYDVEVPSHQFFVANGIVVHNTAKSALMKVSSTLIPRARYVTGRGVTGVGLTATVTRDEEFLGGWVLEAGALVLCNRSILMVDEFEKISKEDQIAFHESMEAQTISIAKASIVATLPAQTAILAGGNPKFGRFDPYLPIKEQIDISETLLSRFDLKFALRDIPNPTIDERMVDHMINSRHFEGKEIEPVIPPELLRKYVAYARKNCQPRLTEEAAKVLKEFYLDLRKKSEEGPIAITPRQLEALIRLSEASAKIQLRKEVGVEDAQRAINLMKSSLRQFGFEPETGMIDIDRAEGQRATAAQRGKIRTMLSIIDELTLAYGKQIPTEEIIKKAKDKGIDNPDEILKKMLNEGVCFSPKPGVIEKIV